MKNKEIIRITNLYKTVYQGEPWHGPSILSAIGSVDAKKANRTYPGSQNIQELMIHVTAGQNFSLPGSHNIAELVQHMIAWRRFTIRRLTGDDDFEVTDQENWKAIGELDEAGWNNIKVNLDTSQKDLINAMQHHDDSLLDKKVANRAYNFYTLLHGIIQHDIYHAGQIALLKK